MTSNLLTDCRVTGLHFGRSSEKTFDIEVTHGGRIFKRSGFETPGQAWRWAIGQVYGVAQVNTIQLQL